MGGLLAMDGDDDDDDGVAETGDGNWNVVAFGTASSDVIICN